MGELVHQKDEHVWRKDIARFVVIAKAVGQTDKEISFEIEQAFDVRINYKTLRQIYRKELTDSMKKLIREVEKRVFNQAIDGCIKSQRMVLTLKGGWFPNVAPDDQDNPFKPISFNHLDNSHLIIDAECERLENN